MKTFFRYPGNKKRLAKTITQYIPREDYHEPFVGGGSILLSVASKYRDIKLYIEDIDPGIIDYWTTISTDITHLIKQIEDMPTVTLDDWNRVNESEPSAFRFLFLNMTSFSGMIHNPGPIGGRKDQSTKKWKVDCLWRPKKFIESIKQQHELLKGRLITRCGDTFESNFWNKEMFHYLDPPYYEQGKALYGVNFDHERLAKKLNDRNDHWILSYDVHEWVKETYKDYNILTVMGFSGNKHEAQPELLISNRDFEPDQIKLF